LQIFISLWDKLEQNERDKIAELIPIFLISIGNDLHQSNHSPAATFLETFIRCNPPIKIDPFILRLQLGKNAFRISNTFSAILVQTIVVGIWQY
jgi:hypothetical protein